VSIIPDLIDFFPDAVVVEPYVSSNGKGAKTYGTGVSISCHITQRIRKVSMPDGTETVSSVQVTLAGAFGIKTKDRFTLPERFEQRRPVCLAVKVATDEDGPHHETAYF
jgi:hypothetical protein